MAKSKRRAKSATQPIPATEAITVPLDRLRLSDSNVRKIYDPATIVELAHSIGQRGLIQSLAIRPVLDSKEAETGDYEIIGGGRRFRALHLLLKDKRIEADKPIPCVLKTTGLAEDDSLAENSDREQLHPIDEFRAFQALIDKGKTEDDVAAAYRVTPALVRQRLRLASASPVILKAFENGEMNMQQLMAFCVVEDHQRQEAVWDTIADQWDNDAGAIRRHMTENTIPANDARVRFVGIEAYEKAGGSVLRDLFDDHNQGYVQDAQLLNTMVTAKLEAARKAQIKLGWKWVEAAPTIAHTQKQGMDRLIGEQADLTAKEEKRLQKLNAERDALDELDEMSEEQDARRDALTEEIDKLEDRPLVFDPEDMARAGVFLSISHNGDLRVDAGYIKPEDRMREADGASVEEDDAPNGHHAPSADGEQPEETGKPLSASLTEDLTSFRTVALRNALAQDFTVAFTSVLHVMALGRYYDFATGMSCLQIKLDTTFPAKAPGLDPWAATKAAADRDLAWKKLLPKRAADLWKALLDMDQPTRQGLFAHLASLSVNAVNTAHFRRSEALRHADSLADALGMHMVAAGWTTTAENYLGRVTKEHILAAVREAKGEDTANLIAHLKKDAMVTEAERLLQGTGWLPAALRSAATVPPADGEDDSEILPDFLSESGEGEALSA